jgi:hypothetical protein
METEVNAKFEAFMDLIIQSFNTAFPLELNLNAELNPICHLLALAGAHHFVDVSRIRVKLRKKPIGNRWITQGIRTSSKNMRFFSMLKNHMILTEKTKLYIDRYKIVYKRVVKEAERRENDKFLLNVNNKFKAVWQIINKETGRTSPKTQDIIFENFREISNSKEVTELFNSYFCKIPGKLSNKIGHNTQMSRNHQFKIKDSVKPMFFVPVSEMR